MLTAMPAHPIIHCNVKQHCNAPKKLSNFSMYSQLVVPMCQERVGRHKKLPADANLYVIKNNNTFIMFVRSKDFGLRWSKVWWLGTCFVACMPVLRQYDIHSTFSRFHQSTLKLAIREERRRVKKYCFGSEHDINNASHMFVRPQGFIVCLVRNSLRKHNCVCL